MLLLTANESKHLAWVSRAIKKPVSHEIHLLFILRLLLFSLSFFLHFVRRNVYSPLSQISVSLMPLVNYHLALPFRRAPDDVYLPVRHSGIYRANEFRRATDLSNYTDRRPLISVPRYRAMSRVSDAVGERASFKSPSCVFRARSDAKKKGK